MASVDDILHGTDGIKRVPYERELVTFVDYIIETRIKLGRPTSITNQNHWDLIEYIYKGWRALYPEYAIPFEKHMKNMRANAKKNAVVREGEAIIQHQLEIPERLYQLINIAFPDQKWDKKFVAKFAQHFPQLMGTDRL